MAYRKWTIPGQSVRGHTLSIEKADSKSPYVATLWEGGLPVARKPISDEKALAAIATLPAYQQ